MMTDITYCGNAMIGTMTTADKVWFTFGRTVVVTNAWVRNKTLTSLKGQMLLQLMIGATESACMTVFGTWTASVTVDGCDPLTWAEMEVSDQTFTATDILGITVTSGTNASAGIYDFILRYKEA
jgi:hypothetical protein